MQLVKKRFLHASIIHITVRVRQDLFSSASSVTKVRYLRSCSLEAILLSDVHTRSLQLGKSHAGEAVPQRY